MLIALKILVIVAIAAAVLIIMIVRDNRQDRRTRRSTQPEPSAWTVMAWTDDNVDRDGTIRHATVYGPFHGVEGFMIAQKWSDLVEGLRPNRYRMEIILQPVATITNSPLEVQEWPEYAALN
jgi:hypothetical protein